MTLTSTTWNCQRCGAACTCDPPWYGLCDQCLADLQAFALESLPESVSCPSCGGPACPGCGDAMPIMLPVPVPPDTLESQQVTGLVIGYRARPQQTGPHGDTALAALAERVLHQPGRIVLSADQSDCLRDMLTDAIAYNSDAAARCSYCQGTPAEECEEHGPAWSLIEAYRQLAAELGEVTGDEH